MVVSEVQGALRGALCGGLGFWGFGFGVPYEGPYYFGGIPLFGGYFRGSLSS